MGTYAYFPQSGLPVFDAYARPVPGARLYFYAGETTTPITVYRDADLTTAHPWPVECDAGGMIPGIYLSLSGAYNVVVKDASDALIRSIPRLGAEQAGESSIQSGKRNYAVTTGTASAYVVAFAPAFIGVDDGTVVHINPHVACAAGATLDAGDGPLPICYPSGAAIAAGEIATGAVAELVRASGTWMLIGGAGRLWTDSAAWQGGESTAKYYRRPDGLIEQMGIRSQSADETLIFPSPFPSVCFSVVAIPHLAGGAGNIVSAHVNLIDQYSAVIRLRRIDNGGTITWPTATYVSWIALGA